MSAHTLGPWKAVHENVAKEIDCFEVASVSHMRVILRGGGWPAKTGKPEDDARLIAAAPELLAALADCVACLAAIQLSPHHKADVLKVARAAIAAATGAAA